MIIIVHWSHENIRINYNNCDVAQKEKLFQHHIDQREEKYLNRAK